MNYNPINRPLVFVLGAGAHIPFGFPSGAGLREDLLLPLFGSASLVNGFTRTHPISPLNSIFPHTTATERKIIESITLNHEKFRSAFLWSLLPSIDDFLRRRHNDFGEWGKSLVAHLILMYERRALSQFTQHGFDWFGTLWSHINCPIDRLDEQQVIFITFNYDRTIEHLLCMAAAHAGGRSPAEAWEVASRVKVIHLHGSVGMYLPEGRDPIAGHLAYGHTPSVTELWESHSRFDYRLYWEANRDSSEWGQAKEIIRTAHEIYVLGVGSAVEPLNDLFGPDTPGIARCRQFLCATGLRSAEIGRLTTATKNYATGNPPPPNPEDNAQDVMRRYFDPSRFLNRRSNSG